MTAVAAVLYACTIGSALIVAGAHLPSEVAGGFCVATAWAAASALLVRRQVATHLPIWLFAGLALLVVAAATAALFLHPGIAVRAQLHPRLVEALAGIAAVAATCVVAFTAAISNNDPG